MKPENMTILTIDDTPSNIRLLTHYLEKQGYGVLTAEDGFEGFKAAIKHKPDLVLLDVMMPGTDGYEVCELLKAEEETKDIPVMFLTAKADVEDKIRGFELGAVDYITKPFNLIEISTRVKTQLTLKHLQALHASYKKSFLAAPRLSAFGPIGSRIGSLISRITKDLNEMPQLQTILKKWMDTTQKTNQIERINLEQMLGDTIFLINDSLDGSIAIEMDVQDGVRDIQGDRMLLQQTFANVILAMGLRPEIDEIKVEVKMGKMPAKLVETLESTRYKEYVLIDVHTPNIPIDDIEKDEDIDTLYFSKEDDHIALGVSTLQAVISDLEGTISMQNVHDKGFVLTAYIPPA